MTLKELLLMRHEWLLVFAAVTVLFCEIALPDERKKIIPNIAIGLSGVLVLAGFLPSEEGSLFGGMYITDHLRIFMKNILQVGAFLIFLLSEPWLRRPAMQNRSTEFYLLIFSSLTGASYLLSAGHFLMFYLALELLTLPVAALAAFEYYEHKSAEAGIKLILSSAFSSAVLLFGISLLYATGTSLYFHQFVFQSSPFTLIALIFLLSGLAFKISLVPFHLWTADVYEGSPTANTAYLSVISKGASVFVLILVLFSLFKEASSWWNDIIYVLAALTMTIGNLFALRQHNLKRFLAFSSIAQAGFIMLGVVQADVIGAGTVLYFVFIYLFSNLAAFGVVMVAEQFTGAVTIRDFNGFYSTNPRLSLVMLLALFSLAGIPPLAGFFGKFFLFMAVAERGYYLLLGIAVLNAVISLYYYLIVVKAMFIEENPRPLPTVNSPLAVKFGLLICVAGMVVTGFIGNLFDYIRELVTGWLYGLA
ncbi:MAG: NADH-quinone oxidoreductase subunit N [Cyclobacteriaceae bacterium]|nr:NADH-quinone oxidoreductase subunit N [Cyclobacteriaceae bacterium]